MATNEAPLVRSASAVVRAPPRAEPRAERRLRFEPHGLDRRLKFVVEHELGERHSESAVGRAADAERLRPAVARWDDRHARRYLRIRGVSAARDRAERLGL